jgi:hypothetical protein
MIENQILTSDKEYYIDYKSKYFNSPSKALELVNVVIDFLIQNQHKVFTLQLLKDSIWKL